MLYCYDCGSDDISNNYKNNICNECGSEKILDDEEENLREKILQYALNEWGLYGDRK